MKNQYNITKSLMMNWAKEYHIIGKAAIITFICMSITGAVSIGELIFLSVYGGDWIYWFIFGTALFVSVYKLFFQRFVIWSNRYKLFSKTYGVAEWLRTTEFTDDEIIITDHNSVSKFRYENIRKIKEKNNVVMMHFNNNLVIRLYKDAFTEGTWEDCKKILSSYVK